MDKTDVTPRKEPVQERSRFTVDAIVEATFRVLESQGVAELTTTLVAKRAGVSVGTLYQYFPSREALLEQVLLRHRQETIDRLVEVLAKTREQSLEIQVRALVSALIEFKRRSPRLSWELSTQLPPTKGLSRKHDLAPIFRRLLEESGGEASTVPRAAIFAAVHGVEGALVRALDDPEILESEEFEKSLVRMALAALAA